MTSYAKPAASRGAIFIRMAGGVIFFTQGILKYTDATYECGAFRLRQSSSMAAFLDSVNACALALMAGVTLRLGVDALRGWPAGIISLAAPLRWKVSAAWIVLAGGIAGFALSFVR